MKQIYNVKDGVPRAALNLLHNSLRKSALRYETTIYGHLQYNIESVQKKYNLKCMQPKGYPSLYAQI